MHRVPSAPPPRAVANQDTAGVLRVVVANSKGGCGKTTVATNLASLFAAGGHPTALFDYDPQGSSVRWLGSREEGRGAIHGVAAQRRPAAGVTRSWQMRVPPTVDRVVTDTPAGIEMTTLVEYLREAQVVLVPVLPSPLDIDAAAHFVRDLCSTHPIRCGRVRVGIVANRIRRNTRVYHELVHFLVSLNVPIVGRMRDSQQYVHAASEGRGVHEAGRTRIDPRDARSWAALKAWVEGGR